jgi:hypothetical protein
MMEESASYRGRPPLSPPAILFLSKWTVYHNRDCIVDGVQILVLSKAIHAIMLQKFQISRFIASGYSICDTALVRS